VGHADGYAHDVDFKIPQHIKAVRRYLKVKTAFLI
jgi:hypothetical protein